MGYLRQFAKFPNFLGKTILTKPAGYLIHFTMWFCSIFHNDKLSVRSEKRNKESQVFVGCCRACNKVVLKKSQHSGKEAS